MSEKPITEEYAERRTDWAEDRTLLANERTYAGWLRTAGALMGIGLALQAIFGKYEPTWAARLGASGFVIVGIFVIIIAHLQATKLAKRLNSHSSEPIARRGIGYISTGFAIMGFGLLIILWTI